jgi:hypothetical protein
MRSREKTPGLRLTELFKIRTPAAGPKTAKAARGKAAGAPGTAARTAVTSKSAPEARKTTAGENVGATAQTATAKASPFGNGNTTSKDFAGTGARIYSSIKWQEEQAHFQMAIRPYTDEVKKLRRDKKETVCIDLVDGRGRGILTLSIPVDDMKPVRDERNKITSLEYGKDIPLGRVDFLSIQDWQVKRKV